MTHWQFHFYVCALLSYLTYKRQVIKRGTTIKNPRIWHQMKEHKQKLHIKCAIRMIEYPKADSPMLIGFFKPVLVLPEEQYGTEERKLHITRQYESRADLSK